MKIIIDTREKIPWKFESTSASTEVCKLDTGDYSLEGFEKQFIIERKKSVSELAGNITQKRFVRELQRMSEYECPFMILEFDFRHIDDFPNELPYPVRKKIKISGNFIISKLSEYMVKYNVKILPCSCTVYAEHVAYSIMKKFYEKNR